LVFITVVESIYGAVRTDSLYKADYVQYGKLNLFKVYFTESDIKVCEKNQYELAAACHFEEKEKLQV